jgi:integrase
MRRGHARGEIVDLRWPQLDLEAGAVRLGAEETKTDRARPVYFTKRAAEALALLPRHPNADHVFVSSRTGSRWAELRPMFPRAGEAIGRGDIWFPARPRSSPRRLQGCSTQYRWSWAPAQTIVPYEKALPFVK